MRNVIAIAGLARLGYDGRNWYNDARREIEYVSRAEGWNSSYFAGILAATSPRCVVRRNIRLGLEWMHTRKLPKGTMKSIVTAATNFDATGKVSGPKVSAFYENLTGNDDCITWDTHMFMAFVGRQSMRVKELARAESILREVAVELDLTPAQCQAAIWAGWRCLEGWNRSDFPVIEEWFNYITKGGL